MAGPLATYYVTTPGGLQFLNMLKRHKSGSHRAAARACSSGGHGSLRTAPSLSEFEKVAKQIADGAACGGKKSANIAWRIRAALRKKIARDEARRLTINRNGMKSWYDESEFQQQEARRRQLGL